MRSANVLLACLLLGSALHAQEIVPLKKGEKIIFLGDSITELGGNNKKTGYINVIKNALDAKYKDLGIETVNAGISGHKVPDLQKRLQRDVLDKKPTIVFIYIGINDVWHGLNNPKGGTPIDKFESGLNEIIGKITDSGARVILCTPTVIGEKKDGTNQGDKKLDSYSDVSRKIAKEKKLQLCDLRKAFVDYLKDHNPNDKDRGILTYDGVHLSEAGDKLVAETMLKMIDK
jgi:lysophospholipase L1-like esterase